MPVLPNESNQDLEVGYTPEESGSPAYSSEVVPWVMDRVWRWRNHRDSNYLQDWEKYYNIWRGKWDQNMKQRSSERSRIIAPATQQAVDQTVAEMVEAIFGRGNWFDIKEDMDDPRLKQIAEMARDNLLADFDKDKIKSAIIETLTNGAVFGTGIAKRIISEETVEVPGQDPYGNPITDQQTRISVKWESIPVNNFVIDTAAVGVEDALGVAHEAVLPIHTIQEKQATGEYYDVPIGTASGYGAQTNAMQISTGNDILGDSNTVRDFDPADGVYLTEYHGKIPRAFLEAMNKDDSLLDEVMDTQEESPEYDDTDLVEAIVVIANGGTLLKCVENPIIAHDRGFVAYQHHKCPNRFWGIGVVEKAYNPQVALDAELRARIDTLGLLTYPVMGADATRLPRNLNLQVTPGKIFLTNGRPSEVLEPINFGNLEPSTFEQSANFERMVESATGALNNATPINTTSGNMTASGMSMGAGSVIKRAKLTMHNVDADFLDSLVRKTLIVKMQLEPNRYPVMIDFTVNSTMSIMAREFEQVQLTNLLAIIPPESTPFLLVLKAIVDNMSGPSRSKIAAAIDQQLQPNPQAQQMQQQLQQLQMAQLMGEVKKLAGEVAKLAADTELSQAKTVATLADAQLADEDRDLKAAEIVVKDKQANAAIEKAKQKPAKPASSK